MTADVGGQCGNSAKKPGAGGGGGVNPRWDTTLDLPGDVTEQVWKVKITSDMLHTVKDAAVTVALDSSSKKVTPNGIETLVMQVPPGQHVLSMSTSGNNPFFGCGGAPNGTRHNEQQHFNLSIEAQREHASTDTSDSVSTK